MVHKVKQNLKLCGFMVLLFGVFIVLAFSSFLVSIPFLGLIFSLYLGYASLALGCLIREARKVQKLMEAGDTVSARKALSMLVTRDTENMNEQDIYRSLSESVSENYNDGFCAPFLYLSLLGVPWVWAYKMVSTMDSMWGYKTSQWKDIGYAGARLDDVLAYIPARLGVLSMLCGSYILGLRNRPSLKTIARQAGKMESPNAGWTMSAAANLLNVSMGGNFTYFGKKKVKPVIGVDREKYSSAKVDQLISLILISSVIYAAFFITLAALLYL